MGLFSRIFGGKSIRSAATSASFLGAYREAGGQSYSGGGWGLDRFNSIIDAHSSVDDMIEEWGLADEGCRYQSLDGYSNPYTQAYREERERAEEAMIIYLQYMKRYNFMKRVLISHSQESTNKVFAKLLRKKQISYLLICLVVALVQKVTRVMQVLEFLLLNW